jgi:hypothetical protein
MLFVRGGPDRMADAQSGGGRVSAWSCAKKLNSSRPSNPVQGNSECRGYRHVESDFDYQRAAIVPSPGLIALLAGDAYFVESGRVVPKPVEGQIRIGCRGCDLVSQHDEFINLFFATPSPAGPAQRDVFVGQVLDPILRLGEQPIQGVSGCHSRGVDFLVDWAANHPGDAAG